MNWWDNIGQKDTSELNLIKSIKYQAIVNKKTNDFKTLINDNIEKGYQYRVITDKSFNALVVLEFLLEKYTVDEIIIAIYRMNIDSVNLLKKIIDEKKIKCSLLLSDFFRENKKYERWTREIVEYGKSSDLINVQFANNHAKVLLAHTTDERYIVFEGSGNLSDNARIEQYLIEDNEKMYIFHKNWILNKIQ
jgi:hypothetical protein